MNNTLRRFSTGVVLVHAMLILPHAIAHAAEQATLPAAANAFVATVIVAAPVVALALLWSRQRRLGGVLLLASMLAALLFGIMFHYVLPGTDHVAHIPAEPWQPPFRLTAGLLALSEAIGAAVGGWILYRFSRAPSDTGIWA